LFPEPFLIPGSDPDSNPAKSTALLPALTNQMADSGSNHKIMVTGATSIIGKFLLPGLLEAGHEVHAISRRAAEAVPSNEKLTWHQADISQAEQIPDVNVQILIHLAPLWLLPPLLPVLNTLQLIRVIGFGSTSVFSKAHSAHAAERKVAIRLAEAEEAVRRFCSASRMDWTIFRPTLVYDCVRDKNITRIAGFIRRYGFFPLIGQGAGLRQPIHAADLAQACMTALFQPMTFNKAYNLSGGETLSYRQMVEKIFSSLGRPAHFLIAPLWLYRLAIRSAMLLPGKQEITTEMATRMNIDLCFDHTEAASDFGFAPRAFSPEWGSGQEK
jgi:nucleoside-diphosphate-sugar epimerase